MQSSPRFKKKYVGKREKWKGQSVQTPSTFTWHDDLVAGYTLGGELITVALIAEQRVILAGERLICQRAIAAETAEAVLVIVPVFVEELLAAEQEEIQHK